MGAHRPGRPEDLPHPDLFWAAGSVHAMLEAITEARFPLHTVTENTVRYEDGGGNWWALARIAPGRAVLYGEDSDMSKGKWHTPPVDLLTGAPAWLPWKTLVDLERGRELGYVYWWQESTGWERVDYPADLDDDGIAGVVMQTVDRDELLSAIEDEMPEGADVSGLLRHVEERSLTAESLAAAFASEAEVDEFARPTGEPNLDAGLAVARRVGVLAGSSPAELPPGTGAPADRRVERLSTGQHAALVHAAMREAAELERPEPVPDTARRAGLARQLRSISRHGDGRTVLIVQVAGGSVSDSRRHERGPRSVGRDTYALVEAVCAAESTAHPERGRPLFLRAETTPDTLRIDTAYDSMPEWWAHEPRSSALPWSVEALWHEMARRAPQWRPAWGELLEPDIRCDGPPERWAHLPIPRNRAELWGR